MRINFPLCLTVGKGSSSNPCKEIFRGESPFSEPETVAVRDFVLQHSSEIEAFVTLHSYSQIWMYPYGHDYNNYPPDVDDLVMSILITPELMEQT